MGDSESGLDIRPAGGALWYRNKKRFDVIITEEVSIQYSIVGTFTIQYSHITTRKSRKQK